MTLACSPQPMAPGVRCATSAALAFVDLVPLARPVPPAPTSILLHEAQYLVDTSAPALTHPGPDRQKQLLNELPSEKVPPPEWGVVGVRWNHWAPQFTARHKAVQAGEDVPVNHVAGDAEGWVGFAGGRCFPGDHEGPLPLQESRYPRQVFASPLLVFHASLLPRGFVAGPCDIAGYARTAEMLEEEP